VVGTPGRLKGMIAVIGNLSAITRRDAARLISQSCADGIPLGAVSSLGDLSSFRLLSSPAGYRAPNARCRGLFAFTGYSAEFRLSPEARRLARACLERCLD
jgi:hypothetical protein